MAELQHKLDFAKIYAKDQIFKLKRMWQMSRNGKNAMNKDPAYNATNPSHFIPMIEKDRYIERVDSFDQMISATHKHFWDPNDKSYIDFDEPFDMENEYIVDPDVFCMELRVPAIANSLTEKQKIKLNNESFRWVLSQILHGEQGALSLLSLIHI